MPTPTLGQNSDGSWDIISFYHSLTGDDSTIEFENVSLTFNGQKVIIPKVTTAKTFDPAIQTQWKTTIGEAIDDSQITIECPPVQKGDKSYIISKQDASKIHWDIRPYSSEPRYPDSIYFLKKSFNIDWDGVIDSTDPEFKIYLQKKSSPTEEGVEPTYAREEITDVPTPTLTLSTNEPNIQPTYDSAAKSWKITASNPTQNTLEATITATYIGPDETLNLTDSIKVYAAPNYDSGEEEAETSKLIIETDRDTSGWLESAGTVTYTAFTATYKGSTLISKVPVPESDVTWSISLPGKLVEKPIVNGKIVYNIAQDSDFPKLGRTFVVTARYNGFDAQESFQTLGDPDAEIDSWYTTVISDPPLTSTTGSSIITLPHSGVVHFNVYREGCAGTSTITVTDVTSSPTLNYGFRDLSSSRVYKTIETEKCHAVFYYNTETKTIDMEYENKSYDSTETIFIGFKYPDSGSYTRTLRLEMKPEEEEGTVEYKLEVKPGLLGNLNKVLPDCNVRLYAFLRKYVNNEPTNVAVDVTTACTFSVDDTEHARVTINNTNRGFEGAHFNIFGESEEDLNITVTCKLEGFADATCTMNGLFTYQIDPYDPYDTGSSSPSIILELHDYENDTWVDVTNKSYWDETGNTTPKAANGSDEFRLRDGQTGEEIGPDDAIFCASSNSSYIDEHYGKNLLRWKNFFVSTSSCAIRAGYGGKYVVYAFKLSAGNTNSKNYYLTMNPTISDNVERSGSGTLEASAKHKVYGDVTIDSKWRTTDSNVATVNAGIVKYKNNTSENKTVYIMASYESYDSPNEEVIDTVNDGITKLTIKPNE